MSGGEARSRWEVAGRPVVPSLVVDGVTQPVLHVSQLAEALDLAWCSPLPPSALAADTVAVLAAWVTAIAPLDLERLLAPSPSRGRSLRNLTVNVCHPFELLPAAWTSGSFHWHPERDGERELALRTAEAVSGYASRISDAWEAFVVATVQELDAADPMTATPRGAAPYSVVLDTQRWHAAYHLRQLEHVLGCHLTPPLERLALPADVF